MFALPILGFAPPTDLAEILFPKPEDYFIADRMTDGGTVFFLATSFKTGKGFYGIVNGVSIDLTCWTVF